MIAPFTKVKCVTPVPFTPLPPVFMMRNDVNDGLRVLDISTPWLVVF